MWALFINNSSGSLPTIRHSQVRSFGGSRRYAKMIEATACHVLSIKPKI